MISPVACITVAKHDFTCISNHLLHIGVPDRIELIEDDTDPGSERSTENADRAASEGLV